MPTRPLPRSGLDVAHHVLDAGVIVESVAGQVLAVAGVLEAAMWHLGRERYVRVDPDRAEVELARGPHCPAMIASPHARREAVLDSVGPAQGLSLGLKALNRDDRSEDLVLDHLVVLPQPRHHSRGEAESACAYPLPAGSDGGVSWRTPQEALDPGQLRRVVQRAEIGIRHLAPRRL